MPYKVKGHTVVKADTGKVVGHSKNPKKYLRVLRAVEHGWRPSKKGKKHHSAEDGSFLEERKKRFGIWT